MKKSSSSSLTPEKLKLTQVPGFSDYYASKSGNVFSMKSGVLKRKKIYNAKDGYCTIGLTPDGDTMQYRYRLHIIIAKTFHPNPENLPTVNHKDGNGRNNRADNLEWMSYSDQSKHACATGLTKKDGRAVCQADKEGNLIAEFSSMTEAEKETGISVSTISSTCRGEYRQSGGYVWYYKGDFKGQKMRKFGNCKTVYQYNLDEEFIREFESADEAAKSVGVHPGTMADACRGKQNTCKGYIWKYSPKKVKEDVFEKYKDWVILDEFPKYSISNKGEIFSHYRKIVLKPSIKKNGVKTVSVTNKDGESKTISVHQLVARAYLPNPKKYPLVQHLDDDPSNDNVENLKWGNHSTNGIDAYATVIKAL